MKKIVLLAIATIMGASASFAQLSFGVKGGFSATNFWGEDINHGIKPSYQAGLLMEYKFTDKFAISPEVLFTSQGGKISSTSELLGIKADGDMTFNTNYINVPVMLKYYVAPCFSIDFGPQVGFNVYSKTTASGSIAGIDAGSKTADLKDNTIAVDFGVGLGGTFNVTDNLFVQARYTMGFTKVFDGDQDIKNGNIFVGLGYKF